MTTKDAQVKDGELCRKEFETWAKENDYDLSEIKGYSSYANGETAGAWDCWQDLWASRQSLQSQLAIAREALEKSEEAIEAAASIEGELSGNGRCIAYPDDVKCLASFRKLRDKALKLLSAEEKPAESESLTKIAYLIGSIFFYGNFKAETAAERELEILLRQEGFFFETEDDLLQSRASLDNPVVESKS